MDIPDIRLVVQYKATCNLCTLWQRFGRAARGSEWDATAILLVEKKNTEEDRLLKAKRAAERKGKNKELQVEGIRMGKRKKPTDKLPLPPSKRPALADRTLLVNRDLDTIAVEPGPSVPIEVDEHVLVPEDSSSNVVPTTQDSEALEAEWLNKRCLDYQKGEKHATNLQKKGQEKDMVAGPGTPIDDFINANLHVRCRRKIVNLYFGNNTDRRKGEPEYHYTSDSTASHACQSCHLQS
jgi:superfamily II DNA/RNA helicase